MDLNKIYLEDVRAYSSIFNNGSYRNKEYEVKRLLWDKGYDTTNKKVKDYIKLVCELVIHDTYDIDRWYEDTLRNYPEELEDLPKRE